MDALVILNRMNYTLEHTHGVQYPFLVRVPALQVGYLGQLPPAQTDIHGYGKTFREAATEALKKLQFLQETATGPRALLRVVR